MHILKVPSQLSCGDTCQTLMWYSIANLICHYTSIGKSTKRRKLVKCPQPCQRDKQNYIIWKYEIYLFAKHCVLHSSNINRITVIESRCYAYHIWQNVNIQLNLIPMEANITLQIFIWKTLYHSNNYHGFSMRSPWAAKGPTHNLGYIWPTTGPNFSIRRPLELNLLGPKCASYLSLIYPWRLWGPQKVLGLKYCLGSDMSVNCADGRAYDI